MDNNKKINPRRRRPRGAPERVDAGARLRGDDVDDGDQGRSFARSSSPCLERLHDISSRRAVALREHDGVRDAERVEGVEQVLAGPSPYIAEDQAQGLNIPAAAREVLRRALINAPARLLTSSRSRRRANPPRSTPRVLQLARRPLSWEVTAKKRGVVVRPGFWTSSRVSHHLTTPPPTCSCPRCSGRRRRPPGFDQRAAHNSKLWAARSRRGGRRSSGEVC